MVDRGSKWGRMMGQGRGRRIRGQGTRYAGVIYLNLLYSLIMIICRFLPSLLILCLPAPSPLYPPLPAGYHHYPCSLFLPRSDAVCAALDVSGWRSSRPPPLIHSIIGPHHLNDHVHPTLHIPCTTTASFTHVRLISTVCAWYARLGGRNAHPCSFIKSSSPTTSTTMYTPSYTSHVPPPQVLHTSDCYRLHAHSMRVWGQSAQPRLIIEASATIITMTMYSPPYASHIPPLQVLCMSDRY